MFFYLFFLNFIQLRTSCFPSFLGFYFSGIYTDFPHLKLSTIAITPSSLWVGVVVLVRVPSMGQMDLFKNYSYSVGWKNTQGTTTQKYNYEHTMNPIS